MQSDLFLHPPERPPLVVAYGLGGNSTAALNLLERAGTRPDLILFADTGDEKAETYAYLPILQRWLERAGFPPVTTVRYQPKNFKNWPPYGSLSENCLTNGTLPSLAFGFKSCSIKWKITPQNQYCRSWAPAVHAWRFGIKVRKLIGYDATPNDRRRYALAQGLEDARYEYWYPLVEQEIDREGCKSIIESAGLPIPPKSACTFCPSTKTHELRRHARADLVRIVIMEARAKPRLRKIDGLWRRPRKRDNRPGSMTEFIRREGLLDPAYVDYLIENAPTAIVENQQRFTHGEAIPSWHDFLEAFTPEDDHDGLIPLDLLQAP